MEAQHDGAGLSSLQVDAKPDTGGDIVGRVSLPPGAYRKFAST